MDAAEARNAQVRRVVWVTLGLNLAVAAAKVAAGTTFHVLSLTADGLHSTLDGLSNVVGLVALRFADRPPDAGHPYGHRKLETFAALGVGVSLGLMAAGLVKQAVVRAATGEQPEGHPLTFAVALVTFGINLAVSRWEARRGRALGSAFLVADAQHTRGDALVTSAVLVALVGVRLHVPAIDVVAAFGIAAFIVRTAIHVIAQNVNVLADAAAVDPARVASIARRPAGVVGCHAVRSRGPIGHVFVDLHLEVAPEMSVADAHALAHRVAATLKLELPEVVEVLVHVEPRGVPCGDAVVVVGDHVRPG